MITSNKGIDFITAHEGERLHAYKDAAGKDTIGIGHLLLPGEWYPNGITEEQSRELLRKDLRNAEQIVNSNIKVPLSQDQFDALVSLAYNIPAALTSGTIDDKINSSASKELITQTWLSYNKAGGVLVPGLLNRRSDEVDLYFNSVLNQVKSGVGYYQVMSAAKKNPLVMLLILLTGASMIGFGIYKIYKN